jgi:hypothetical protein
VNVFLLLDGAKIPCPMPEGSNGVTVPEMTCPECRQPLVVGGAGSRPSKDDRAYEADASCLGCRKRMGTLRVETDTIFGVREDERVLNGRVRVY